MSASLVALAWLGALAPATTPEFTAGSDWPSYRHDATLSGISPLKGGLARAPRVAWSVDLGGPRLPSQTLLIRDVTGDGRDEILILGAASIECRDALGVRLWARDAVPTPSVLDVRDYAGDGSRGILLSTARGGRVTVFMVDGRTGGAVSLWADQNNFGGHTRFGKLLQGVAGAQLASTSSGQTPPEPHGGGVRLVSFEDGLARPRFRVRVHVPGDLYSPIMLFDDLDGDGAVEMAVISHETLWSFDTETGRQEFAARYAPMIRTYSATVASVRLAKSDPRPSLVMINPHLPGLEAVRQDGRSQATRIWKVVVGGKEDQYQSTIRIAPGGADVAADLDDDGRYELLASITNEHGDRKQHLVIFDAATGKRLAECGDERVVSVDDLDGDGHPEVVLQGASQMRVAHWVNDRLTEVWHGDGVEPLLRPVPSEGTLSRTAGGSTTVWRETSGSALILCRFPDGVHACRFMGNRVDRGKLVATHEALGNAGDGRDPQAERVAWDGGAAVSRKGADEVYRYEPPSLQTYLAPPPLVATLAGSRQVMVRDASGKILLIPASGGEPRVLIENAFEGFQTHVDHSASGPTICDIDGDGENDIVATLTGNDGKPFCAVLDANGRVKRRMDLEPGTALMNRGPTGSLGPGRGRWMILRMYDADAIRRPLVVAFDGKTGEKLWVRDRYGSYGPNTVAFAAHLPTAVLDFDGDGADDWLACSENFYGIISVSENRDLVPPMVLSSAVPGHWTAYTYPSLGRFGATGEPCLLHNNSYAMALITDLRGRPLWHEGMTRDTAGTWGILTDVDGDGASEFIHAQPDGLIRCFGLNARRVRCSSCPAEGAPANQPNAAEVDSSRWTIDLKHPVSRFIAADLDADGRQELVLGGSDGNLHALGEHSRRARILWKLALGRRVGEPILADLDGDNRAEILVATEDGRLYCLQGDRDSTRPGPRR